MKKNKSEIVLIVDRSGSMSTIKQDMEGGFKTFLEAQKAQPGEASVTYYQFDTVFEKVFETVPLKDVSSITIDPRGGTALLDAVGRAINEVGERLAKTAEAERPESVIVVIVTDGEENSSREFTSTKVREMIKHQEDKYSWKFVFLGGNIDAVKTGASYGLSADSTLTFGTNKKGINASFDTLRCMVSGYRSGSDYVISEDERSAALGDEK